MLLDKQREKTHSTQKKWAQLADEQIQEDEQQIVQTESKVHQELESREKARAEAKAKAEKEAIAKITEATMAGIKAGEEASKKLHADAKRQSDEQTVSAVEKLKDKFDHTKNQVMAIVNNFGKIRSDMAELKQEYIQEQNQMMQGVQPSDQYIQLFENMDMDKLAEIKREMTEKNQELI